MFYEDDFLTIVDGATNRSTRLKVLGVHQWESAFSERTGMRQTGHSQNGGRASARVEPAPAAE
jgi:hypothetical protein